MLQGSAIKQDTQLDSVKQSIKEFMQTRFPALQQVDLDQADQLLEGNAIDSLGLLDLVTFLEETFDVTFHDDELSLDYFNSVGVLADLVSKKQGGA